MVDIEKLHFVNPAERHAFRGGDWRMPHIQGLNMTHAFDWYFNTDQVAALMSKYESAADPTIDLETRVFNQMGIINRTQVVPMAIPALEDSPPQATNYRAVRDSETLKLLGVFHKDRAETLHSFQATSMLAHYMRTKGGGNYRLHGVRLDDNALHVVVHCGSISERLQKILPRSAPQLYCMIFRPVVTREECEPQYESMFARQVYDGCVKKKGEIPRRTLSPSKEKMHNGKIRGLEDTFVVPILHFQGVDIMVPFLGFTPLEVKFSDSWIPDFDDPDVMAKEYGRILSEFEKAAEDFLVLPLERTSQVKASASDMEKMVEAFFISRGQKKSPGDIPTKLGRQYKVFMERIQSLEGKIPSVAGALLVMLITVRMTESQFVMMPSHYYKLTKKEKYQEALEYYMFLYFSSFRRTKAYVATYHAWLSGWGYSE